MANKIKSSDIFEEGLLDVLLKEIKSAETKLDGLSDKLKGVGKVLKDELGSLDLKSLDSIQKLLDKTKELQKATDDAYKVEKERLKLENQKAILEEKLNATKKKYQLEEEQRLKKIADAEAKKLAKEKKIADDLANAYKQLEKNTRDLKNESKRLGAEMLELERSGQQNTKAYRDLENQYRETTKQALEGDKALKKLDQSVGDNFRSVGHYEKALGFLKGALSQLGLAFGAFEGVRYLIDTQVKLDSLSLSLKNVSSNSIEYGENVKFLRKLSKDYGQDLLNITETYKNFIASTDNSNLSLEERRRIYETFIKAGSSLALSNDDVAGTLRAVQQMFSKGTVQAEELRQQLGDRLPGAFSLMAKAMGVTEEVLNDMLKKGLVLTDDVMPRFATEVDKSMGANARARVNTLGGSWNNLKNEVLLYFNEAQSGYDINRTLADSINFVANNLKEIIGFLTGAIKLWASYKLVVMSSQVANKLLGNSFLDLVKSGKATASIADNIKTAFGELGNFLKTNWIGILALIGTEIFATYKKIEGILSKISEYRKELKQAREDVVRQSKEERIYLDTMFETLKKTNFESNRRKEIIDEINSKYGTTIKNIKDEKTFLDQLNQSYKDINKTLDKKLARDIGRIRFETTQRQLAEAKTAMDIAETNLTAFRKSSLLNKAIGNLGEYLGATGETELVNILNASRNVYYSIEKLTNKAEEDYKKLLKTLGEEEKIKPPPSDTPKKDVPTSVQQTVDLNTGLPKTNEYISQQIELLKELNRLKEETKSIDLLDKEEKIIEKQRKSAEEKGKYDKVALTNAINKQKAELLNIALLKKTEKEQDAFNKAEKAKKDELDKLNEARAKRQLEIDKKYKKYLHVLEVNAENSQKNLSANAEERVKDRNKKLSKDAKEFLKAQTELQKNYDEQLAIIIENDKKRLEDANTQKLITEEEYQKQKADIEKNARNKLNKEIEDNDKAVAEKKLENIKKIATATNDLVAMALDNYVKTIERKINMLEDKMSRIAQNSQYLQDKAVAGNILAEESLAKAQADQLDAEKQKINYQKSIQRLQMAMAVFNAYNNNIQNAKVGENPFTKTITDVSMLSAFIGSLPQFYTGTETTVAQALGQPQLSGKDGHIIRVDGSEKILNPYLSQKTGDLTTFEIAKIAEDRLKGKLVYNQEVNSTANNMWASMKLIDEIQDLKSIIKNKPETNIAMGEIVGGVMKIVETTKVSNTTTRNIHRFNKKI